MSKVVQTVAGAAVGFFTGGPIGAVVGAVGAFASASAAEKREKAANRSIAEQQKANAINNAQQAINRQRQIRQSLAEARVRRAQIAARAFEGGPAGAGQNITGDVGSAIGNALTQQGAAFGITTAQNRAASFNRQAQSSNSFDTLAGIAGLFSQGLAFAQGGGFQGLFQRSGGPAPVTDLTG